MGEVESAYISRGEVDGEIHHESTNYYSSVVWHWSADKMHLVKLRIKSS
jgi:hypothetical protein